MLIYLKQSKTTYKYSNNKNKFKYVNILPTLTLTYAY